MAISFFYLLRKFTFLDSTKRPITQLVTAAHRLTAVGDSPLCLGFAP